MLAAFEEAARRLDLDPAPIMGALALDQPRQDQAGPGFAATLLFSLIDAATAATGRSDFPLIVALTWRPPRLGPGDPPGRTRKTVTEGLEAFEHRVRDWNGALSVKLTRQAGGVLAQPIIVDPSHKRSPLAADLVMALCLRNLRWILGEDWWPDQVLFAGPEPMDATAHQRHFGSARFNQACNGLLISEASLALPIEHRDAALSALTNRHALANAVLAGASMTEQVCELIARLLPTGQCTVDRAAHRLGLDRRTIHRRLAAEGQSFTGLVEQIRRTLVADQIRENNRSLTVIANLAGFSSLSTFSRWHRAAFGAAARDCRRSQRTAPLHNPIN